MKPDGTTPPREVRHFIIIRPTIIQRPGDNRFIKIQLVTTTQLTDISHSPRTRRDITTSPLAVIRCLVISMGDSIPPSAFTRLVTIRPASIIAHQVSGPFKTTPQETTTPPRGHWLFTTTQPEVTILRL